MRLLHLTRQASTLNGDALGVAGDSLGQRGLRFGGAGALCEAG